MLMKEPKYPLTANGIKSVEEFNAREDAKRDEGGCFKVG
jgi:hypothetical protein